MQNTLPQMIKPVASNHKRCGAKRLSEVASNGRSPSLDPKSIRSGDMKAPVRLLIVDDHPVVRRGVASALAHHKGVQIIGEAAEGQEALRKMKELAPDVVLMDADMPQMDGL